MHELAITQSIIDACSERAAGARVLRVTLEVGTLTCVLPGSLQFCFEVARKGTPLADAALDILRIAGRSLCNDCGAEVDMKDLLAVCDCGSGNLARPDGGDELRIRSIEIEEAA